MENGKENKTGYRVEQDSIGVKDIPGDVYYGVQSLRAAENFRITGLNMHPEIINSLAYIKKASAITNCESGILEKKKAKAIVQACDEILTGKLHEYFIVDPIQGGAGTSLNMNANEVIANRAIELLGGQKGGPHGVLRSPVVLHLLHQDLHLGLQGGVFLVEGRIVVRDLIQKLIHHGHIVAAHAGLGKYMGRNFLGSQHL